MAKTEPLLTLGFSAISWIEHFLVHGPGDVQGQEIELDDEFAAFIVKGYRLNRNGSRRIRRAFLSRAKGRSKSGLAGFIACFEALGPCRFDHFAEKGEVSDWGYEYAAGEPVGRPLTYAEVLCVATEEGQAGNTYDGIYYMLHPDTCSEALLEVYGRLDVGLTRINLPNKRGFIEPVTSADTSADGGKSTFIVADETHLWILPRLKRLHGIMTRNLLKRKVASGWMLETSTMYGAGEGSVAEGTHAYAKSPAAGAALLFDHRQAADTWDLTKRRERILALREAYGPAAAWMNLEAIADSWDDPQVSEAEWRRFWLNQPVMMAEVPVLVLPNWPGCRISLETPPTEGIALGVAVSLNQEWSTIAAGGQWGDERTHVSVTEDAAGESDRRHGTGWLAARLLDVQKRTQCQVVMDEKCPDADLARRLRAAGVDVTELPLDDIVTACAWFYTEVDEKRVTHFGDPDLEASIAGAAKRTVGDGRWVWGRRNSSSDVAALEAATLAGWASTQPKPTREFWGAIG
jgi:hypothetical protein